MQKYDVGIAGQFSEIVQQIARGGLNPIWVRRMFQQIIVNDHSGDESLLCQTCIALKRPTLSQIAEFLDNPADGNKLGMRENSVDEGVIKALLKTHFIQGPEEVDLVKVTANLLLEANITGWSERKIRDTAHEMYGLVPCPMWVIPALALVSKAGHWNGSSTDYTQVNVCANEADQQMAAFNMIFGQNWWIRLRSGDLSTTWEQTTWLMAKPSVN